MNKKFITLITLLITTILITSYLYIYAINHFWNRSMYVQASKEIIKRSSKINNRSPKVILLWTWLFRLRWPQFKPLACDCDITSDRSYLTSASAVVFHFRDLNIREIPERNYIGNENIGLQKFVLMNHEPPYLTFSNHDLNYDAVDDLIDWTMTYRRDSDIYAPYGRIIKRGIGVKYEFNISLFNQKKNDAAWFVSNCETEGRREDYVDELRKYMTVDIYGACGEHKCSRSVYKECYEMVEKEYKFYLAFENSVCKDYISEKLFRILNYDVVPVVYGDSNAYKEILPKDSYIDARKFAPKALVSYLEIVASNASLYASYFDWKKDYYAHENVNEEQFCALCDKLWDKTSSAIQIFKRGFKQWWFDYANCQK